MDPTPRPWCTPLAYLDVAPADQPARGTRAQVVATRDPALLSRVVDTLLGTPLGTNGGRRDFEETVVALLKNPHLSVPARHRLVGAVRKAADWSTVLATFDPVPWTQGDEVVAHTWYEAFPWEMADPDRYGTHLEIAIRNGLTADLAAGLPLPLLKDALLTQGRCEAMKVQVEHLAIEVLGEDHAAWAVFAELFATFEGSLADALASAAAVAT